MPDLWDLKLPHSELPDYDYDKFVSMQDSSYQMGGFHFEYKALDRSPGGIKVDRPVAELLRS